MAWYYLTDSQEVAGPVSEQALKELNAASVLTDASQVCREGTEEWVSLAELFGGDVPVPDAQPQVQPVVIPASGQTSGPTKFQKKWISLPVFVTFGVLITIVAGAYFVLWDGEESSESPTSNSGEPASTIPQNAKENTNGTPTTEKTKDDPKNPTSPKDQWFLGYQYYEGWEGFPQDFIEAAKWYRKAALQGDETAQLSLGQMYIEGKGVKCDYGEAARWLTYASERGLPLAQYKLACVYLSGVMGTIDKKMGYMWLNLAASSKDDEIAPKAQKLRDKLADEMPSSELKEAQRLSRNWRPKSWDEIEIADNDPPFHDPVLKDPDDLVFDPDDNKPIDLFSNSIGMKFSKVDIPSGPSSDKTIFFSIWETRKRDFEAYAKSEPTWLSDSKWKTEGKQSGSLWSDDLNIPVTYVNHADASSFCLWLTGKERKQGLIPGHAEYRLPSDHEWSCAVGIGEAEDPELTAEEKSGIIKDIFPWGREWPPPTDVGHIQVDGRKSGFDEGLATVGSFRPGKFGLYDMAGNVGELVWDSNSPRTVEPSRGSSCATLALRKEPFFASTRLVLHRDSFLYEYFDQNRSNDTGFRCVLELTGPVSDLRVSLGDSNGAPNNSPLKRNSETSNQAVKSKDDGPSSLPVDQHPKVLTHKAPPTNFPESALAALSMFEYASLDEAKECIRLLDEELAKDQKSERIALVKTAIMDVFRTEASLQSALNDRQEAGKRLEVETRNLKVASKPSSLSGKVNRISVNNYQSRVNELRASIEEAATKANASHQTLQELLNSALTGIPSPEGDALAPVWQKVAGRNGINISK